LNQLPSYDPNNYQVKSQISYQVNSSRRQSIRKP